MQLISNGTQGSSTMPTKQPTVGTPGFANSGTPGSFDPTILDPDVFNTILAEFKAICDAAGISFDPTNNAQVLAAIKTVTGPGRLLNVQTFTTSGTYTPTAGTNHCIAEVVGGGGSGGGAGVTTSGQVAYGAGGGGGGYAKGYFPVATLTGLAVTVGAGGAGSSSNGTSGGASSIGTVITGSGGGGGSVSTAATPPAMAAGGTSGVGTGGNLFNAGGGAGGPGIGVGVSNGQAGSGGGSVLTGGVIGPFSTTATGNAGFGPGAGSSGAASQNGGAAKASSAASAGIVLIYEFS